MQQQSGSGGCRRREERRRTVLSARIRDGSGWSDACILNISPHGMMIYASCTAELGSQVALRYGDHLVIAQVVWRNNQRVGLWSCDELPAEEIVSAETAAAAAPAMVWRPAPERRRQPRDSGRSRGRSQAVRFLSLVLAVALLTLALAASMVEAALMAH